MRLSERVARGICITCGKKPARTDKVACVDCAAEERKHYLATRYERCPCCKQAIRRCRLCKQPGHRADTCDLAKAGAA